MGRPVQSIRNLGPAMAEAFARAGLKTADEIEEMGLDAAYARLIASGHRAHFIAYYALAMGLQGRPWNDLSGDEKSDLRRRFDRIKSQTQDRSALEKELDTLGLRPKG